MMKIIIVATGGTIDKIYFDDMSAFQVGDPQIIDVLKGANVAYDYEVVPLLRKDSLHMTDDDRRLIHDAVSSRAHRRFVITHGTDTMIRTARTLMDIPEKVIVLTGSMQPARFRVTDAVYNIASAMTAVQLLPCGVYIAMNGRIFDPNKARKNRELNRFEE